MGAIPLVGIPAAEKTIRRSHIDELRSALVGDQIPRGDGLILPEGVPAPAAGAIGTPQNPWGDIYARDFLLPDGTSIQTSVTPQFPDPRVVISPFVPGDGNEGSCGQLRFSPDGSYIYTPIGTVISIAFESHEIGFTQQDSVPTAARVSAKPTYNGNSLAEIKRVTLVDDAWWYNKGGVHSPLESADVDSNAIYGVWVDTNSRVFLGTFSPYGAIRPDALLTDTAIVPANSMAHVVDDGQWYRFDGTTWTKTDQALLGCVAFKGGAISKAFSIRTSFFVLTLSAAPSAAAVVGVDTGFGSEAAAAYAGEMTPYFRGSQNRFVTWAATNPTLTANRLVGTFDTAHSGTARPRDVDWLFYGLGGTYGWANNNGDDLSVSVNGNPGVHAYLPARVILSATFTGAANSSVRFVPGFFDGTGDDDNIPRYPSF